LTWPAKNRMRNAWKKLSLLPNFWNDQDQAKKVQKELGQLQA